MSCCICYNPYNEHNQKYIFVCKHDICGTCLNKFLKLTNKTCPLCRIKCVMFPAFKLKLGSFNVPINYKYITYVLSKGNQKDIKALLLCLTPIFRAKIKNLCKYNN